MRARKLGLRRALRLAALASLAAPACLSSQEPHSERGWTPWLSPFNSATQIWE